MATRSVIARLQKRKKDFGFIGVYHHWDGGPDCLGATLFHAYNGYFRRDIKAMLKYLIDDHPAGWSSINDADFGKTPGYRERTAQEFERREHGETFPPVCYCHGERKEEANVVTNDNAAEIGCEWAYVFDEPNSRMFICSAFHRDGNKAIGAFGSGDPQAQWLPIAVVNLEESEPDWELIEQEGKTQRRPLVNFV